jgi:hypothetical protein
VRSKLKFRAPTNAARGSDHETSRSVTSPQLWVGDHAGLAYATPKGTNPGLTHPPTTLTWPHIGRASSGRCRPPARSGREMPDQPAQSPAPLLLSLSPVRAGIVPTEACQGASSESQVNLEGELEEDN